MGWTCQKYMQQSSLSYSFFKTTRPVLEYACPVWHSGLTVEHRNRIEAIQKRVFTIIFDTSDYVELCTAHNYFTLHERRDLLCRQFFQIVLDKSNCLNYLLPELRSDGYKDRLRRPPVFKLHRVRITRFNSSFISYTVDHYVWSCLILRCLIIVSCRCSNERVNVFILYYLHFWVFCIFAFTCVFCNPALGLQC